MELLILPLALLGGFLVLLTIGIILWLRHGKPTPHDAEYETLRARYARGEISRTVYDRRRRELEQRARTRRTA
ncbi:MAG TPA: hypothetical protein VIE36_12930 [Methylomirabilota bacterium]|jgi:uncharacterized membrane protein